MAVRSRGYVLGFGYSLTQADLSCKRTLPFRLSVTLRTGCASEHHGGLDLGGPEAGAVLSRGVFRTRCGQVAPIRVETAPDQDPAHRVWPLCGGPPEGAGTGEPETFDFLGRTHYGPRPGRGDSSWAASRPENEWRARSDAYGRPSANDGMWTSMSTPGGGDESYANGSTTRRYRGVSGIGVQWSTPSSAGSYARCVGGPKRIAPRGRRLNS